MSDTHVPQQANLVDAFALHVADAARRAGEEAAGHGAATPVALVALHQFAGGRSVEDLRQVLGLTHSGAVRLVDRLVAAGHAERRPGASAREVAIHLTPSGRRTAQRVLAARAAAVESLLDVLSAPDRARLARIAGQVLGAAAEARIARRAAGDPPAGGWLCRTCDLAACGRHEGECPVAEAAAAAVARTAERT